jgi:hypothetical protein
MQNSRPARRLEESSDDDKFNSKTDVLQRSDGELGS